MILKKLVFDELEIRGFFIFQLLVVCPCSTNFTSMSDSRLHWQLLPLH